MKKDVYKSNIENIVQMMRTLAVLVAILTALAVGGWAIYYALINALWYVLIFIIGAFGLGLGVYSLAHLSQRLF